MPALWYAVQTVTIASFGSWPPKAGDTLGIYFSSRGFHFDPYYKKAILSRGEAELSGKAAFLLEVADSLAEKATQKGWQGLNLHRRPEKAPLIQNPNLIPSSWVGLAYIQRLELYATPQKIVYAESNRFRSEVVPVLSCSVEGIVFTPAGARPFQATLPLPPETWQTALVEALFTLLSN
ncbi:MAG: hypothetical protein D6750_05795 [Bacteroidetes bacterium]|nr:MAG: hypothetical protein D6750_05795 [Bacteroidota bacterium]